MMEQMQTRELISAMADGQLRGEAFARGMDAAASDAAALEAWQTYHLIGDVLRSSELAAGTLPGLFLSRLQSRLEDEPRPVSESFGQAPGNALSAGTRRQAASNDTNFRWKLVAGFASLTALAAIGWSAVGEFAKPQQTQLAAIPSAVVPVVGAPGPMMRDARLDEFLAAHRQLAGTSALQAPAGFLRNAAFESGSR
jgi:sigma-E factor negative regulatory protein RseA